ncbi:MAG: DNA polymerase IV [Neomegalonema sp.]
MTGSPDTRALCRDCLERFDESAVCPNCGSHRVVAHPELDQLSIAHMDCDAFYALVEKRDDPSLNDKPLIVGGGQRGVVTTCCYLARIHGVRSAMPMFKALKLCPDAVVRKPRMTVYVDVSREIRALMDQLTPAIEPLSLDEAFLDLTGTERLHGEPPAASMARLVREIETQIGISASVGLSHNKFLAKIASDLDKPRGFAVIGAAETQDFLAENPVSIIWGVGKTLERRLIDDGIRLVQDLRRYEPSELIRRYGAMGGRLARLCWGDDTRAVASRSSAKSVSNETTFNEDISDPKQLEAHLWRLTDKLSSRLKAKNQAGRIVLLKLKTKQFRLVTRRASLEAPTHLANEIFRLAASLLHRETGHGTPYRLIGVGVSELSVADTDAPAQLFDRKGQNAEAAERAIDDLRARFGDDSIKKGRSLG